MMTLVRGNLGHHGGALLQQLQDLAVEIVDGHAQLSERPRALSLVGHAFDSPSVR
jgi:hypothetical protein